MAKPVNEYYQRLGETPDALVELGKINDDGVKSGFKVTCAEENGQIKPHYLQLDNSGTLVEGRKGGTIARGGGSFQVKHGDYVRDGIPGVYIDSGNGDLVLISEGRIRIIAENIDLIATGGDDSGNININSSGDTNIRAYGGIRVNATDNITIFSQLGAWLEGANSVYILGKDVEVVDGGTRDKGSQKVIPMGTGSDDALSPLHTIEEFKRSIRSLLS